MLFYQGGSSYTLLFVFVPALEKPEDWEHFCTQVEGWLSVMGTGAGLMAGSLSENTILKLSGDPLATGAVYVRGEISNHEWE
jgi:hypothetical protein